MTPARRLRPFTPNAESFERLDARTVGREAALRVLADRLQAAATSANRPHTLIVGPRGSGKSHVVEVALGRAARTEVADRLVVVPIDEDAVGITRVDDLYVAVLRALAVDVPPPDRRTQAVSTALAGRVLVLVLHNLDRIFHALGVSGQQDFRAWVENSGDILVLGTTPALFSGIREHSKPWYNGFGIVHLDELTVAQGRELLTHLAREYDDEPLAQFLATDDGEARLKAVHALAGGSPRIWMILSECLTVEVLDDLVAAVEGLLEGLVPYYQQLLWELSPHEQRIVRSLAEGPGAAETVAEIAAATNIEQRTVATTLGRLTKARWVVAAKAPGTDRRTTWYRLAEPMLRHHFQYRAAARQPLQLVVELLRATFDRRRREQALATSSPASEAERLLATSLLNDSFGADHAWSQRDATTLLAEAKRWIAGHDADRRSVGAGEATELVALTALGLTAEAHAAVQRRNSRSAARVLAALEEAVGPKRPEIENLVARTGRMLATAAEVSTGRDGQVLRYLAASWILSEPRRWPDVRAALLALTAELTSDRDPLRTDIELARLRGEVLYGHSPAAARLSLLELQPVLARENRAAEDLLDARSWAASAAVRAGPGADLVDELAVLIADTTKVFGARGSSTSYLRLMYANCVGLVSSPRRACDLLTELVASSHTDDRPRSADAALIRLNRAIWAGRAGDWVSACSETLDLLTTDSGLDRTDIRQEARRALANNLVWLASSIPDERAAESANPLLDDLVAALGGDVDAHARLSSELLEVVEELQRAVQPDVPESSRPGVTRGQ